MARIYDSGCDCVAPEWYWTKGLHDAKIKSYIVKEFDYDYALKNSTRNCLELKIDATHALMDSDVKSIKFYNFKCDNLPGLENSWWLEDRLNYINGRYQLKLKVGKLSDEMDVVISFDSAEVER